MEINPETVPTVVVCNVLDENFLQKYVDSVLDIRSHLSLKGDTVGPLKTCGEDPEDPVFKLIIQAKDGTRNLETCFLIYKGDGNPYWFFAGGEWRHCGNAIDDIHVGQANCVPFNCSNSHIVTETGLERLCESIQGLVNEDGGSWEDHLYHLSFVFLDAARFDNVFQAVVKAFDAAINKNRPISAIPSKVGNCPAHWKAISDTFHDYFGSEVPKHNWMLPETTVIELQLPVIKLDLHDVLKTTARQEHLASCLEMICLLCPKKFL